MKNQLQDNIFRKIVACKNKNYYVYFFTAFKFYLTYMVAFKRID